MAACCGFLLTVPCSVIMSLAEFLLYTFVLLLCGFMAASIRQAKHVATLSYNKQVLTTEYPIVDFSIGK